MLRRRSKKRMTTYNFEIDLVPALWLHYQPTSIRLAELINAEPWKGCRFKAPVVIKYLDDVALRVDTGTPLRIRWGGDATDYIQLELTADKTCLKSVRACLNCKSHNDVAFHTVSRLALTFDLAAVSAFGHIILMDTDVLTASAAMALEAQIATERASKKRQ